MTPQFRDPTRCRARALLLGERLDLRSFPIADCLSTTPLTLHAGPGGGIAVLFRYGVVVLFGTEVDEEAAFLERLRPLVTNPYAQPETDGLEVRCGTSTGVQGGVVSVDSLALENLQVIADALSKSLVLSLYENRIQGEFDRIEPLSRELAQRGSIGGGSQRLLSKIGALMLIEHRMVGRAEIGDKPETLWEHPRLGSLYASLEDEYELHERQSAIERKLRVISETAHTLAEILDKRQLHRMEWYVIGLIAMEILINLLEFTGVLHR